jgi:hypothetical protein
VKREIGLVRKPVLSVHKVLKELKVAQVLSEAKVHKGLWVLKELKELLALEEE